MTAFIQTFPKGPVWTALLREAALRGLSVQELIRSVAVPEWLGLTAHKYRKSQNSKNLRKSKKKRIAKSKR